MSSRKLHMVALLFCCSILSGQNMQILYDFNDLPQTLMLNPGSETELEKHLGVPLLSNLYLSVGASNKNINYNNVVAGADNEDEILRNVYDQNLSGQDVFKLNQQIEVFSMGFRLKKDRRSYLSFGIYQEVNAFSNYPPSIADLYFFGNDQDQNGLPEFNDPYTFSQLNGLGEMVGVWHLGINRRMSDRLSLGARVKLLSGVISFNSINNDGNYRLTPDGIPFQHQFRGMDLTIRTSGIINRFGTNIIKDPGELLAGVFFTEGNLGFGADLGFSYDLSEAWTLSGSLIDLGFINYQSSVTTYDIAIEDFNINDTEFFQPPEGDESTYWKNQIQSYVITGDLPLDTLSTNYLHFRPTKLYGALKYTKTRKQKQKSVFNGVSCEAEIPDSELETTMGIQVFNEFRPQHPLWAVTAFYSREFTPYFAAKFTYTADRFSITNLGAGLSFQVKSFNLFATADNLLALPRIRDSNYQSIQLGMNFVFR